MIRIELEYLPFLHLIAGRRTESVELPNPVLSELLALLDSRNGPKWQQLLWEEKGRQVSPHIFIAVNGELVRDLDLVLSGGDKVVIMPGVDGG